MLDDLSYERELELHLDAAPTLDRDAKPAWAPRAQPERTPVNATVHDGVFKIFVGLFVAILAAFFVTFRQDAETVFMIGICAVYGIMYFSTPLIMRRVAGGKPESKSWAKFLAEPFATYTGPISGRVALLQICIVPAALTVCVLGICVIIGFSR